MDKIITVLGGCGWDKTFNYSHGGYSDSPTSEAPGSKGANQAVAAARAGAEVHVISLVGSDDVGRKIIENLQKEGIHTEAVERVDGVSSDCTLVKVDQFGDNQTSRVPDSVIGHFTKDLIDKNAELLKRSGMVIAQTKVPKEVTVYLIDFCAKNKIDLVLTPCTPSKFEPSDAANLTLLKKVKWITANEKEALKITGAGSVDEALKILPNMLVTKGPDGVFYSDGKKIKNIPALQAKVVDTTGAGDTFCGNFTAAALSGKYDFVTCIKRGIAASTIKIGVKGAQLGMPTAQQVTEELNRRGFAAHCDLHTHTLHSDGGFSAMDVVGFAVVGKLSPFSITDHDSVDAYYELADKKFSNSDIQIFSGVELSFSYNGIYAEVLGYGFAIEKMNLWLSKQYPPESNLPCQQDIFHRGMEKYRTMGVKFTTGLSVASGNKSAAYLKLIGDIRIHANQEKFPECFEKDFYRRHFSNPKSKYFVDETMYIPTLLEAVNAIHSCGGLAMLAHPGGYGFSETELEEFLDFAVRGGVDGFEFRYPKHSAIDRKMIKAKAEKYNLLLSGGSDFHGAGIKAGCEIGKLHPNKEIDANFISDFKQAVMEKTVQGNKSILKLLTALKQGKK